MEIQHEQGRHYSLSEVIINTDAAQIQEEKGTSLKGFLFFVLVLIISTLAFLLPNGVATMLTLIIVISIVCMTYLVVSFL
ncbi:MAG: hypothetical protein NT121_12340 [Chloroflexi bacterium]|nr:hypothetical protein [Chloroflexota bacterium]